MLEAVIHRYSQKGCSEKFCKIPKYVFPARNLIKKETLEEKFSCELGRGFQNSFFA